MKQLYTHFLFFFMSCLCIGETKNMMQTKTDVVRQNNKRWKIKTVEGGAKEKGDDYQEDIINGEIFCYFTILLFLSFKHKT